MKTNKDISELVLSKESSESEIRAYFNAVLKLSQSDNEFPINLEEVWPLVYSEKGKAVRALTSNEQFIEGVDYKSVAQNGKQDCKQFPKNGEQDSINGWGGNNKVDYYLTVACMEFFIARKVRPVFDVYREVFHKVTKHQLSRKELLLMALQAEEEKERLEIENRQKQLLLGQKTEQLDESKEWYSIKRWAKEHGMNWLSINWRKMKALSYELGYDIKKVFDANYGQVNIYNVKVFEAYL